MVKSLVSKLSAASSSLSLTTAKSNAATQHTQGQTSNLTETNYAKHRNDPGRFFGDGVQFKAKLIGILEVGEARGDRMCQEALQDLKMAIRAAGEHKQRITIHVTIDGLRLRDEKTGDSLYHHPVHKISFIAQDMTDSRAFGYIFGSPDSGHRFFGIKTDKAASQVVLAMRDLFQVVFELKKKEIELARQQIQSKSIHDHQLSSLSSLKNASSGAAHNDLNDAVGGSSALNMLSGMSGSNAIGVLSSMNRLGVNMENRSSLKELSPESVADLVDLEQELSSLQRGITQMERITPSEAAVGVGGGSNLRVGTEEDPFGDSFTNFPAYNLLPPPESGRNRNKPGKTNEASGALSSLLSPAPPTSSPSTIQQGQDNDDDSWLNELDQQSDVFDTTKTGALGAMSMVGMPMAPLAPSESTSTPTQQLSEQSGLADMELCRNLTGNGVTDILTGSIADASTGGGAAALLSDAFTDLDPLGTGRTRPYVDKKYFFQELKNPPKKVLKDLTSNGNGGGGVTSAALNMVDSNVVGAMAASTVDELLSKDAASTATSAAIYATTSTTTSTAVTPSLQSNAGNSTSSVNQPAPPPPPPLGMNVRSTASGISSTLSSSSGSGSATMTTLIGVLANVRTATSTTATNTSCTCTSAGGTATAASVTGLLAHRFDTPIATTTPTTTTTTTTTTYATTTTTTTTTTTNNTTTNTTNNAAVSASQMSQMQFPSTATLLTTSLAQISSRTNLHLNHYTLDAVSSNDVIMMPHDTDPFSPTRKKSDPDPFQEGDIFNKLEPFEFAARSEPITSSATASTSAAAAALQRLTSPTPTPPPQYQPPAPPTQQATAAAGDAVFNSPLQVQLPPESQSAPLHWKADISRLERPASELSAVRSRPTPAAAIQLPGSASSYAHAAALKQQTVDVISSISNKKMPHLFGQARFSKRDSNTINMRRLQESDSLSENETAPEPPPRPDSASYVEPPPLPPKKQFNDIVIRPRSSGGASSMHLQSTGNRYDSLSNATKLPASTTIGRANMSDVPPIPLPSRRVGRSDGTYPGPGRPRKPGHTEDDYLAPISSCTSGSPASQGSDLPPLLPPPTQISTRARTQRQQSLTKHPTHDIYENKEEILQQQLLMKKEQYGAEHAPTTIAPDITLTQLLTLGIDELAAKLNVPTSKLNTMTLVELTSYLSDYLTAEHAKPKSAAEAPVFKVNFDQQATFVAKFDDTFGEDELPHDNTFVANFEQFNESAVRSNAQSNIPAVPPADRYAVFREIIDQELQHQQENTDLMGDLTPPQTEEPAYLEMAAAQTGEHIAEGELETDYDNSDFIGAQPQHAAQPPALVLPKIDTKITEVVAQAKDRYAALRDIILVENLFDKKPAPASVLERNPVQEFTEFSDEFNEDQDLRQIMDERGSSIGTADRLGIVDSRGLTAEASSSALTVEDDDDEDEDADVGGESSGDSNEKDVTGSGGLLQDQYEKLSTSTQQLDTEKLQTNDGGDMAECMQAIGIPSIKQDNKFLTVAGSSGLSGSKDDLEIDELMQRAISNLSLDSRERISPASSTMNQRQSASGVASTSGAVNLNVTQSSQFSDMSTSPIPLQKSPIPVTSSAGIAKSPAGKSPQLSPIPAQQTSVALIDTVSRQVGASEKDSKLCKDSWATFETSSTGGSMLKHENAGEMLDTVGSGKRGGRKLGKSSKAAAASSLHLPPPPPSNTSQNDTAESPCSSDPRDDGWRKSNAGGCASVGGGGGGGTRRWPKKDRQQTSSSSRDISPWDDETPDYQKHKRMPPVAPHHERHGYYMRHAKRMNSCDEDFDYDEEFNNRHDQRKPKHGLSRSRDNFDLDSPSWYHHQVPYTWTAQDIEQARGRSFERSAYERTTYGPPIYDKRGVPLPPMSGAASYDRRIVGGYDKRKYYRDYTRPNYDFDEYGESPPLPDRGVYRGDSGSFEKLKLNRRADYENVYDEGGRGGGGVYKSRADYMYDRERKSFDRESVESFESATRRRRSFGSGGDMYGSLESREDFRERYLSGGVVGPGGAEKTRSLRRGTKLRVAGDIDYEQDSEGDFQHPHPQQQRGRTVESRSLQRPSQLNTCAMGAPGAGQTRIRKSSGSSPWDGEEPPPMGQKSWKRPSSAADSERRLNESRRAAALAHTPSGSDGEKDRRFRKKQRPRAKDGHGAARICGASTGTTGGRYGNVAMPVGPRDNYDYIACDDDIDDDDDYVDDEYGEPPTDEDKFERLNRRRHEMHQRMHESERRQYGGGSQHKVAPPPFKSSAALAGAMQPKKYQSNVRNDYDFDGDFEHTPTSHSNVSSAQPMSAGGSQTKFSFDGGFESDFNQSSPPPAPAVTASITNSTPALTVAANASANSTPAAGKTSFRFSNDFSDRERANYPTTAPSSIIHVPVNKSLQETHQQQFELDVATSPGKPHTHATPPIQQKLRFDDNVKVSQFDDGAFEDDFAKSGFDFEKEDQWHVDALSKATNGSNAAAVAAAAAARKHSIRNSKLQQRQELIKKSESINIFAKKSEDPFEDDEFFSAPSVGDTNASGTGARELNESGSATPSVNFQWDDESNFAKFDKNM